MKANALRSTHLVVLKRSGGLARQPSDEDHLCRGVITFRHTSGGRPQTALSGGGDPTERHAPERQECHGRVRRCGSSRESRADPHFRSCWLCERLRLVSKMPSNLRAFGRPRPRPRWSAAGRVVFILQARPDGAPRRRHQGSRRRATPLSRNPQKHASQGNAS